MRCRVIAATLICMAVLAGIGGGALAETVDLLLVLAADVSRSTDDEEFNLQRKGYANAITDPEVLSAIMGGKHHAIAVTFVEWSGADEQKVVVDWTVIHDGEAAAAMASAIMAAPRSFVGRTAAGAAIDFAVQRLQASPAEFGTARHRHVRRRHQQFRPAGDRGARRGRCRRDHDQRAGNHQ